jgi:UDP-glucose 4-epimerase
MAWGNTVGVAGQRTGRPGDTFPGPALVTGGAGFIGSHLVRALVDSGRRTHVVDNLAHGRPERLGPASALHRMDVREADDLARLVRDVRPATIFHLAAQIDVRRAVARPIEDGDINILGTIAVLEAALEVGARVIFASSGGAAYGEHPGMPIPTPESEPPEPLSPYGMSKVSAEEYCRLYSRLHGLQTVVLRLSNVYGPGQDHLGEAGVVAIFCGCALDGRPPTVFGDGLQTRDYVYVADVVAAFLAAERGPAGVTLNIGTGVESSVRDLLAAMPIPRPPRFAPERPGEVRRSTLDPARAGRTIGWRPRTGLTDGLRMTLEAARRAA